MNRNFKILDCTLRDGGYINDFDFGKNSIRTILKKLGRSGIDIIECGFISEKGGDENSTVFNSVEAIEAVIGTKEPDRMYVAMVALGEKEIAHEKISPNNGKAIDGIRITFHDYEIDKAFEYARALREKGYELFMQPIGTMSYSDQALVELINKINEIKPFAFYIVDTLGTMYKKDLLRLFYLIDHNLDSAIAIGFHSHNNLQLSFSNAQELLSLHTKRTILIDSSIFGMGRGAGNLCTELIARYINDNIDETYQIEPLLEIIGEQLIPIFAKNTWGYSVPYYLAAVNNCHPNYASFLLNKQTLTMPVIGNLLARIPVSKRIVFNKTLIETMYLDFQECYCDDLKTRTHLTGVLEKRPVLLVAPGNTVEKEWLKIAAFIADQNPIVISVNFHPQAMQPNYVFVSNRKRWERLSIDPASKGQTDFIFVSNLKDVVPDSSESLVINYSDVACKQEGIQDNAGLMAINMLNSLGLRSVSLAGFDGFSDHTNENYVDGNMFNLLPKDEFHFRTEKIGQELSRLGKSIEIHFITTSLYDTGSTNRLKLRDVA